MKRVLASACVSGVLAMCAAPVAVHAAGAGEPSNAFNPAVSLILSGTYGQFSQDPVGYAIPGFALGADTGTVLAELGYDARTIAAWKESGVV